MRSSTNVTMKSDILERTEAYLTKLERSLDVSGKQARDILDEARSDLLDHVKRFREQGKDESDAVDLAIAEMGDPVAAATEIGATLPPDSPSWLKVFRILLSLPVICFGVMVLQFSYSSQYGRDLNTVVGSMALLSFFLMPALLLWPTIVWRKNWLFGVIPAGASLLLVMMAMSLGISQSTSVSGTDYKPYSIVEKYPEKPGRDIDRDAIQLDRRAPLPLIVKIGAAVLVLTTIYLIAFIQRSNQRRIVIALALLIIIGFETIYRIDEARFQKVLNQRLDEREKMLSQPRTSPEDAEFTLNWKSQWAYNLNYNSARNYLWIMD